MHILAFMEWYHFSICKHTVDKLSGLHALQSSHYKGDNITNARHLIDRVVLAEVKKNYFFAQTNTCLISDKYQKPCVYSSLFMWMCKIDRQRRFFLKWPIHGILYLFQSYSNAECGEKWPKSSNTTSPDELLHSCVDLVQKWWVSWRYSQLALCSLFTSRTMVTVYGIDFKFIFLPVCTIFLVAISACERNTWWLFLLLSSINAMTITLPFQKTRDSEDTDKV